MTTLNKRASITFKILLTLILLGLTIISISTFVKRLILPYTSEGRYFDEKSVVVYHEQAIISYGILSLLLVCGILLVAYKIVRGYLLK